MSVIDRQQFISRATAAAPFKDGPANGPDLLEADIRSSDDLNLSIPRARPSERRIAIYADRRDEAMALGLLDRDTQIEPDLSPFSLSV